MTRLNGGRQARRDARLGRDPDGRARQVQLSTGAQSEEVAQFHLQAFEKNPPAYDPSKILVGRPPLPFTDTLIIEYLNFLSAPESQGRKGDSPSHCYNSRSALVWWKKELPFGKRQRISRDEIERVKRIGLVPVYPPKRKKRGRRRKQISDATLTSWRHPSQAKPIE